MGILNRIRRNSNIGALVAALTLSSIAANSCIDEFMQPGAVTSSNYVDIDYDMLEEDTVDVHPLSKTCLIDEDDDDYGIKENNVFVDWDEDCPNGYKILEPPFDCNDKVKSIYPGAPEKCNNIDDDCDDETDEGLKEKCFTECGEGEMICVAGKYENCSAPKECCTPESITDAIPCPYKPKAFVFVIDNSGSMGTSDPSKLRYKGVIEFIDKTDGNDKTGLVKYADYAEMIGSITSEKSEIKDNVYEVMSQSPNGQTNIPQAMSIAIGKISSFTEKKVIILLTDGFSNVGTFDPNYISTSAEDKSIQVFTLGLGGSVNSSDLKKLATYDGQYYYVDSASEISAIYTAIFNQTEYKSWKECDGNKQWVQKYGGCD